MLHLGFGLSLMKWRLLRGKCAPASSLNAIKGENHINMVHPDNEKSPLGVRSIEHGNVLGEKITLVNGGRRVAMFGRDDLDPLNFNANLFLDTSIPHISV